MTTKLKRMFMVIIITMRVVKVMATTTAINTAIATVTTTIIMVTNTSITILAKAVILM